MRRESLVLCVGLTCVSFVACSSDDEGVSNYGPDADVGAADTADPEADAATGTPDSGGADAGGADAAEDDAEAPTEDAAGGPDEDAGSSESCDPIPSGEGRVQIGFFREDDCSGEPIAVNSYPIEADAPCYCWPGGSGQNSADSFSCNGGDGSFTYVQYNSLTCGAGDDTPTSKTSYTTRCEQDIPPTLYSMVLDYSACE